MYQIIRKQLAPMLRQNCNAYRTRARKPLNPGIGERLKLIEQDTPDIRSKSIDIETLEGMESDFMNSSEILEHHEREVGKIKKRIEFQQIERKYFKQPAPPNMLSWSEKEQIKYLNFHEPDVWTPQKLATSFPATELAIKKILKSRWVSVTPERIKKHDAAVAKNWVDFKKGQLKIRDVELRDHLKKFLSRDSVHLYKGELSDVHEEKIPLPTQRTEFASIITEYDKRNCDTHKSKSSEKSEKCPEKIIIDKDLGKEKSETYLLDPLKGKHSRGRHITLEELRKRAGYLLPNPEVSSPQEVKAVSRVSEEELIQVMNKDAELSLSNNELKSKKGFLEPTKEEYLLKIEIPDSKKGMGKLFRVKDCYYDSEGEFLYRVPGMTRSRR